MQKRVKHQSLGTGFEFSAVGRKSKGVLDAERPLAPSKFLARELLELSSLKWL